MELYNGLTSFALHASNPNGELTNISSFIANENPLRVPISQQDSAGIARRYLKASFNDNSGQLIKFKKPAAETNDVTVSFKLTKSQRLPFTNNKLFTFSQELNKVSVYGSGVNIEMDSENNLISLNASLAYDITDVKLATISPDRAIQNAKMFLSNDLDSQAVPLLYYYFYKGCWKLVYMIKEVLDKFPVGEESNTINHFRLVNLVIDAGTGELLEKTPGIIKFTQSSGADENGINRHFNVFNDSGTLILIDTNYPVFTYTLSFQSFQKLPGTPIVINNGQWVKAGVSAHFHTCEVAEFLRNELNRNNIDGNAGSIISTIEVVENPQDREWYQAGWVGKTKSIFYGQTIQGSSYRSVASCRSIVAHEMFHGIIYFTSQLEMHGIPGVLNESYSDIFAIIYINWNEPDIDKWIWEVGEKIGNVLPRSLSRPSLYGQPEHITMYRSGANGAGDDIHLNNGIHNRAAYLIISYKDQTGKHIFSNQSALRLFYLAAITLRPTSTLINSFEAMKTVGDGMSNPSPSKIREAINFAKTSIGL